MSEIDIYKNIGQQMISDKEKIKELQRTNNDLRKIYRNTYNKLFEKGNDELARYFQAQINDCPTFYVEPIIDYHKEWEDYKSRCEKAVGILGKYKHLSSPTEEQAIEQEEIVENAYDILNGRSDK